MFLNIQQIALIFVGGVITTVLLFYILSSVHENTIDNRTNEPKQKIQELNKRLKAMKETINRFEIDEDASKPEIIVAERIVYWCGSAVDDMVKLNVLKVNKLPWKQNNIPLPKKILKSYIKDIGLDY